MGVIDGVFRFALGVALLGLSYGWLRLRLPHDLTWGLWIAGAALGFTGLFRYCPVYAWLGTDSCAILPGQGRQPPAASTLDKDGSSA